MGVRLLGRGLLLIRQLHQPSKGRAESKQRAAVRTTFATSVYCAERPAAGRSPALRTHREAILNGCSIYLDAVLINCRTEPTNYIAGNSVA